MKIVALGDTHGRTYWKKIVQDEPFDLLIFMGDYFDTMEGISPEDQIKNFEEIIKFKEEHLDKVILLIGNHDFHYFKDTNAKYSRYEEKHAPVIQELIEGAYAKGYLQMSFLHENILFIHAGVTKTWAKNNSIDLNNISFSINELFRNNKIAFSFTPGLSGSKSGDDKEQTPIWVRPFSLVTDKIDNYVQVVGHTQKEHVLLREHINLIDCLGKSQEYFIWEDGEKRVGKVK